MTTRYIDGHGTTLSDEMCVKKREREMEKERTIIVRLEKVKEDGTKEVEILIERV